MFVNINDLNPVSPICHIGLSDDYCKFDMYVSKVHIKHNSDCFIIPAGWHGI